MAHPNASKGKRWELWCAKFLHLVCISRKGDHNDLGDLGIAVGKPDSLCVYECKDDASRSPMQWWEQATDARDRAGVRWCIVLSKVRLPKRGQPKGWAQMSIEQWRELREYIRALESSYQSDHRANVELLRRRVVEDLRSAEMGDDEMPLSQGSSPFGQGFSAA